MELLKFITDIVNTEAGSSTFVVLLFGGLGFLIWKVSYFHTKYQDLDKMEEKFDNKFNQIEGKFDNKFNQMEEKFEKKFDRIEGKFADIKDDLSVIKAFIELQKDKVNPMAQRQSPIRLTEIGNNIDKEIDASGLVDKYWGIISDEVNKKLQDNCNPYDIQVASFEVGDTYQKIISSEELDRIKINAYNHGYDLMMYELLFGIIIRDKVLKERGISTDDVDKYDPNMK